MMKKVLKTALKIIIGIVFAYIGLTAVCGFNMMQTTSLSLSLTRQDDTLTSYMVDFKNECAYITEYKGEGVIEKGEKITLSGGQTFKIKAVCAMGFVSFWGENYYKAGESRNLWSMTRTRNDVYNISGGGQKHPVSYPLVESVILEVFEEQDAQAAQSPDNQ